MIPRKKWLKKFFYEKFFYHSVNALHQSLEDVDLIGVFKWIFDVSKFLRLFMVSFNYGLILLRYFLVDSVLFLSALLLLFNIVVAIKIANPYWFEIMFFFLISLIMLCLISWFSFFRLKIKRLLRFLFILVLIALFSLFSLKIFLIF